MMGWCFLLILFFFSFLFAVYPFVYGRGFVLLTMEGTVSLQGIYCLSTSSHPSHEMSTLHPKMAGVGG